MQYIHYGHKIFEKEEFQEIKNIPHNNKPYGGLWASRKDTDTGWKNWVLGNDLDIGNFNTSFEFSLKKDAKVLTIDSLEVLRNLPSSESDVTMIQLGLLDFEKLSKDYDAIEVLISKDRRLYFHLYGWDCDSIIIMNPDIIIEEKEKEKNLYPQFESGTYKEIYYCVNNDCDENTGGYYIEFYKYLSKESEEIDFDNMLDYMVIHIDIEDEMRNPKKYVEVYIDNLIKELTNDVSEKDINYDEIEKD